MISFGKRTYVVLLSIILLSAPQAFAAENADWAAQMRKLLGSYSALIPYIYGSDTAPTRSERSELVSNLESFTKIAHSVHGKAEKKENGADPSLPYLAKRLEKNAQEALEAVKSDNFSYGRFRMRKLATNCFQCHTRNAEGPEFVDFNSKAEGLKLKPTELSEVYVATRQFDRAMALLNQAITSGDLLKRGPIEFEKGIRQYLAIAIRVKSDKEAALKLIQSVLKRDDIPEFLRERAKRWQLDLERWNVEVAKSQDNPLKAAERLLDQAKETQAYPLDSSADVLYLRASALLHNYLRQAKDKKNTSRAFYLLGHAYEVLNDIGQWYLQDVYYEACIMEAPGTTIAKNCFNRFEMNVFLGYSGSSGVFVPESEKTRLRELRKLAFGK